jgi:hypothetical protein
MSEAIDRPAGIGQSGRPEPGMAAGDGSGTPPGLSPAETYRPLSIPALAGFALAVLYTVVLGIGGLTALFNRSPLLLPWALFLVPLAAVVLSWVGRGQVLSSEGTRSGAAFASWGLRLSLVCGLLYACYEAGTSYAVRRQAAALAEQWLDLLRNDEVARAYRLTIMPALRPPDDVNLVSVLDADFNSERTSGMNWNTFRQSEIVQMFRGGPAVKVQSLGVDHCDYDKQGYRVQIRYRLANPNMTCEVLVSLLGSEAPAGEYEGRQWQVLVDPGSTFSLPQSVQLTPEGERISSATMAARSFATRWIGFLRDDLERAWLGTLPAAEREDAEGSRAFSRCRVYSFPTLAGIASLGAAKDANRGWAVNRLAFNAGGLVQDDAMTFESNPGKHSEAAARMAQAVRRMFASGPGRLRGSITLAMSLWQNWQEKDGVVRLSFPGALILSNEEGTKPQYQGDIRLVLEAPAERVQHVAGWRILSLELLSGRNAVGLSSPGGLSGPGEFRPAPDVFPGRTFAPGL